MQSKASEPGSAVWQLDEVDVPVIVDDVKDLNQFQMTRCIYFTIQTQEPTDGWVLGLRRQQVPVALLGLSGVIYRPQPELKRFESAQQIDALFDAVEVHGNLLVETASLWLPNFLVDLVRQTPMRGDVYRISFDLFRLAASFGQGRISAADFYMRSEPLAQTLTYSEGETAAFADWALGQIQAAGRNYQRQLDRAEALPSV